MEGLASINVQVHVTVSYNYMSSLKKFPCDTYINMLNIYRLGIQVLCVEEQYESKDNFVHIINQNICKKCNKLILAKHINKCKTF